MRKMDKMKKFPETIEVNVLPVLECKLTDHRGPVRRFFGMFNPFKFRRLAGIRLDFLSLLAEAIYHAIDHQFSVVRKWQKETDKAVIAVRLLTGSLETALRRLDQLEKRDSIKAGWLNRIDDNLDALEEAVRDIREKLAENKTEDEATAAACDQLRVHVLEALKRFDNNWAESFQGVKEDVVAIISRLEAVEAKAAPRRKTTVRKGAKR